MKRILFLTNNIDNFEVYYEMLSLAGIASSCGYDSKIVNINNKELKTTIASFNPCYLLANVNIENFSTFMKFLAQIKIEFPSIITIVKGTPFITYNTNAIYENPFIDYVITSEPELVLKDILNNLPNEEILGICYSSNLQGIQNENRGFIENLDELPSPNYYLNPNKIQLIQVSRGCPIYDFCDLKSVIEGNKIRCRSVENIVKEIKEVLISHKKKNFYFLGEIFSFDNNWVKDFCHELINNKIKINWCVNFRVNNRDEEIIKLMKKAGCNSVYINFQTANQEILKNLDCGYSLEDMQNLIKTLNRFKININSAFYIGLPYDNKNTIQKNIDFIAKYKLKKVEFVYPKPIPGTKLFAYAMINKLVNHPLNFEIGVCKPYLRTHELSLTDLENLYNKVSSTKNSLFLKRLMPMLQTVFSFSQQVKLKLVNLKNLMHQ